MFLLVTDVLNLEQFGMFLPKFDIYQDKIAPNCFKSHTSPRCPDFFQDKSFKWCLV